MLVIKILVLLAALASLAYSFYVAKQVDKRYKQAKEKEREVIAKEQEFNLWLMNRYHI